MKSYRTWWKRLRWFVWIAVTVGLLELLTGQYVARPNRILRASSDPELFYESTPGTWLGRAKYDVWTAPLYVVLDLINLGSPTPEHLEKPPPGYTVYRIDDAGCRVATDKPLADTAEVILLGSSQAFGLLVPYEDTVSAMLEAQLQEREKQPLHVANCSVIGHHLLPTLRTAELVQPKKQAKLAVVLVRPWHMLEQFDYTKVTTPEGPFVRWFFEHSNTYRLAFYYSSQRADQFGLSNYSLDRVGQKLDQLAREMSDQGARMLFVLLDDERKATTELFDQLGPLIQSKKMAVERIWTPNEGREYFVDHDQHWNAKGAALTTSAIVDAVQRELHAAMEALSATGELAP